MTTTCAIHEAELLELLQQRERLANALAWALMYGGFQVAKDNPVHGRALDEAYAALRAVGRYVGVPQTP